jgi:dienelactone hydrolase
MLCSGAALAQEIGVREQFLKLIDRPLVAAEPEEKPLASKNGFARFHFTFQSDAKQRVPGIIVRKESKAPERLPVVIALHGTGSNKESQSALLEELAGKGFLAVAIDGRCHGERSKAGTGSADYNDAILRAWRTGEEHPFLYDSVWDIMRLIDYLETRPDVDPARIGMIGFSKGGMEIYLAAAVDPRIRVAVPCIGVQSFRWALDHEAWSSRADTFRPALTAAAKDAGAKVDTAFLRHFYDRVAPGIYSTFDGPAMLPLIAPRPLLVVNGGTDERTPQPGLKECLDSGARAYAHAGVRDRLHAVIQDGVGHRVTPEAHEIAIDWLIRWLKPREI